MSGFRYYLTSTGEEITRDECVGKHVTIVAPKIRGKSDLFKDLIRSGKTDVFPVLHNLEQAVQPTEKDKLTPKESK